MDKDRERRLRVVEDFGFENLAHLFKFTEYLSGAKFRVRIVTTYYDDEGNEVEADKAVDTYTSVRVLYTDGDSGVMEFGFSEIYEDGGYQIELIGCKWCDINPRYMNAINDVFVNPFLYEDYEIEVFEDPCITVSWDSDERNERIINAKKDRENRFTLQH